MTQLFNHLLINAIMLHSAMRKLFYLIQAIDGEEIVISIPRELAIVLAPKQKCACILTQTLSLCGNSDNKAAALPS